MTASMDEEAPTMESMRWVGVDVHAKESLAAVLDPTTGEINTQRISGRPGEAVLEWLATGWPRRSEPCTRQCSPADMQMSPVPGPPNRGYLAS